jgi:NADPH:quinone reductase-like Zn-dependent oxidoreductase
MFNFVCKPKMLERGQSFILNGINNGRLNPLIDKVFPFLDTKIAYEYMESNIQKGKIVVEVNY